MGAGRANPESGYTLVEFVVTAIILMTIAAIGIYQLRPTWQDQQANAGMDQVKSTLRQARETAVAQTAVHRRQVRNRGHVALHRNRNQQLRRAV